MTTALRQRAASAAAAALALALAASCSSSPRFVPSPLVRAVAVPCPAGSRSPRLSVLGDRIVLSWVVGDGASAPSLSFAVRSGATFTPAKRVVADPALEIDTSDVPGVAPLRGGGLAAFWTVKHGDDPYSRDLLVAASGDGGATWSSPTMPHRDGTASEHGMATVVPSSDPGRFGIVWLDGRAGESAPYGEGGTALYWADWNGTGFAPEILLDPRVCDCCKTAAAVGEAGPIVAYRDRGADEARDTSVVRSVDGRWTVPAPIRDDGWRLQACPTNGPAIAASGRRVAVAWFTGAAKSPSVWLAFSEDAGADFGAPVRIDEGSTIGRVEAALLSDGSAAVVWMEKVAHGAVVRARRVPPGGRPDPAVAVAATGASRASGYPRIAALSGRDALVVWTDTADSSRRVSAAEVTLP